MYGFFNDGLTIEDLNISVFSIIAVCLLMVVSGIMMFFFLTPLIAVSDIVKIAKRVQFRKELVQAGYSVNKDLVKKDEQEFKIVYVVDDSFFGHSYRIK